MAEKKLVHDILSESGTGENGQKMQRRPVAFIQHGNRENGNQYEGICPFCGDTTCYVADTLVRETIGGLYRILLTHQKAHHFTCTPLYKDDFAVEIATKPLGTEKAITPQ